MIAKSKGRRPTSGSSGGSRIFSYILIALIVILVGYYVVLPAFTPRSATTTGIPGSTSTATVSLNPGSDISGASVTVTGKGFLPNSNVTISFDGSLRQLTNSSTGGATCRTGGSGALAACVFWVPGNSTSGAHTVTVKAGETAKATFHIPQYTPPVSTVLVTLTSISLGVITQVVTRRVVDLDAERRMRAEVSAFNKEKRDATLAKDKARLDKLKKRELAVQQEQMKVQKDRFKVTGITFVPLLAVYYLMATFLGGYGVIVAYTPIPIPYFAGATQHAYFQVSLFWWYFLSSFTFSTMIGRILHTTT